MSVYADASLLVAAFTREIHTDRAMAWMADQPGGELLTSRWCETEMASALALKVRTEEVAAADRDSVWRSIQGLLKTTATMVAVSADHFDFATQLLRRSTRPLRAGDALQLAIAHRNGAALWTLDRRMAEAGQALGLDAHFLA